MMLSSMVTDQFSFFNLRYFVISKYFYINYISQESLETLLIAV